MATPVAVPATLLDPGFLWICPLLTVPWTNTVAGGIFTDAINVAAIPLGATEDGSTFHYETNVDPVLVAEFFDPIQFRTTSRQGSMAFNLAGFTLSNYRRALNGGVAALTATSGVGATALWTIAPPVPGAEARCMVAWESLDTTVRILLYQTIQGGAVESVFKKAPDKAVIPCTFNMEVPVSGTPFNIFGAGPNRG
jgi:hypothetical protein